MLGPVRCASESPLYPSAPSEHSGASKQLEQSSSCPWELAALGLGAARRHRHHHRLCACWASWTRNRTPPAWREAVAEPTAPRRSRKRHSSCWPARATLLLRDVVDIIERFCLIHHRISKWTMIFTQTGGMGILNLCAQRVSSSLERNVVSTSVLGRCPWTRGSLNSSILVRTRAAISGASRDQAFTSLPEKCLARQLQGRGPLLIAQFFFLPAHDLSQTRVWL